MKSSQSGFTMVEVMVTAAILGAVMLMSYLILDSSTHVAASGSNLSELEQRGGRLFTLLHDDMTAAVFSNGSYAINLGLPANYNNTAIIYQVNGPVTASASGSVTQLIGYTSPTPAAYLSKQTWLLDPTLACILRFEADTILMESSASIPSTVTQASNSYWQSTFSYPSGAGKTFSYPTLTMPSTSQLQSQILNMDINGNGTMTDVFVQGRIMKYVVNSTGQIQSTEQLDGEVILGVSGSGAGAFNGGVGYNSSSDPLFCFTDIAGTPNPTMLVGSAKGILVNVWHGRLDDTGKHFILRNSRMLYHLKST